MANVKNVINLLTLLIVENALFKIAKLIMILVVLLANVHFILLQIMFVNRWERVVSDIWGENVLIVFLHGDWKEMIVSFLDANITKFKTVFARNVNQDMI